MESLVKCIMCKKVFKDKEIIWDKNAEPICPHCGRVSISK